MKTLEFLRRTHAAMLDAGGNLDTVASRHEATQEGSEAAELREDVVRLVARLEGLYGRLVLRGGKAPERKDAEEEDDSASALDELAGDGGDATEAEAATSGAEALCPTEGCDRPARPGNKACTRCYQREWARRKAAARKAAAE